MSVGTPDTVDGTGRFHDEPEQRDGGEPGEESPDY